MKLSNLFVALMMVGVALTSCSQVPKTGEMKFTSQEDSVSYALGYLQATQIRNNFQQLPYQMDSVALKEIAAVLAKRTLNERFVDYFKQNFDTLVEDAFNKGFLNELAYKKSYFTEMSADMLLRKVYEQKQAAKNTERNAKAESNLAEGRAYLEKNKERAEVVTLESGLQYEILTKGTGPIATAADKVECHYHGTLIDGTVFDSSVDRGQTATFGVTQVIKGWTEALQLIPEGSKWRLYIPSELAYGANGSGAQIGPNSVLIFDLEVVKVIKAE